MSTVTTSAGGTAPGTVPDPTTRSSASRAPMTTPRPTWRRPQEHRREDAVMFLAALVVNGVAAVWMLTHDLIFNDAMSRVANGYYVVFSRDPHLPAIGFVWTPLPSLAALPILLLSPLFPVLHTLAAAGNIVSAVCGALATVMMARALRLVGTPTWCRWALVAAFALHPLLLVAAGDGASESMLVCLLLAALVALLRWLRDGVPGHLVACGVALALAYAARYEALAAGAAVALVVFAATWFGNGEQRRASAINDALLVGVPFVATFGLWALISKVIVNQWFATFSSSYGNSAQVSTGRTSIESASGSAGAGHAALYLGQQAAVVAPLAIPLCLVAVALVVARRVSRSGLDLLAIGACCASVLAFDWLTFLLDKSFGWLRFQVTAVPLELLLLGWLAARGGRQWRRAVAVLAVLVLAWTPMAWRLELTHPRLAREESLMRQTADSRQNAVLREIATALDGRALPDGSVVTDVAYSFPVVMASAHPHQFVITPDRDFSSSVAAPTRHGVAYALVTDPKFAPADAVEKQFPGIYENGGGVATLEQEWSVQGQPLWRLYRFQR